MMQPVWSQQISQVLIAVNSNNTFQTISNFGASDAWAAQFVGNWPDEKKNAIADWFFSLDTLPDGSPRGIGLSQWRYNIGAGSMEQAQNSSIRDEWRRAAAFVPGKKLQPREVESQLWFLKAAKKRGVEQFLGFYNSPPVWLTKNGKAFATAAQCNIDSSKFKDFAGYTAAVIKGIRKITGVTFNYISPVNEPQWDWSDGGQEGSPYPNSALTGIARAFNEELLRNKLSTRLIMPEAASIQYLVEKGDKPGRSRQLRELFHPESVGYIGNLPAMAPVVAGHSYFTTSPWHKAVTLRNAVRDTVSAIGNLEFWQSEYCILGDNGGEINGNKKDTGMKAALYMARVIHTDLTAANAAAWQWWTSISAYDYKDGLVYIDKQKTDGRFSDSKMLWVLGNYSRFVRPGMKRIETTSNTDNIYVSGFANTTGNKMVLVIINPGTEAIQASWTGNAGTGTVAYVTDVANRLKKQSLAAASMLLPAESVVTIVIGSNNSLAKKSTK
ncbi:xylanase [Filimonas effusa]|uniref:Xylanase n=2 Tax=Filimonas effusa TaxID=2508721 RepID=A0A4V1MA54_9BACT|nr:xylanase [Filimonas effusa]